MRSGISHMNKATVVPSKSKHRSIVTALRLDRIQCCRKELSQHSNFGIPGAVSVHICFWRHEDLQEERACLGWDQELCDVETRVAIAAGRRLHALRAARSRLRGAGSVASR